MATHSQPQNIYDYHNRRLMAEFHHGFEWDGDLSDQIKGHPLRLPPPPKEPTKQSQADLGIVGAGAAGMYTALLVQMVNAKFPDLKVTYEILEASDRVGGRLYTYDFPKPTDTKYNYYDVGAMRFPKTQFMDRTFKLFDFLGPDLKIIQYYFAAQNTYLYYNGIRVQLPAVPPPPETDDPFHVTRSKGGDVPDDWASDGYQPLVDSVLDDFTKQLAEDMKKDWSKPHSSKGWRRLMQYDDYSTRGYMSDIKKYPTSVINWLETRDKSTAWYDQALSETVIEAMAFNSQGGEPKTYDDINKPWRCIDGGTRCIADAMERRLDTPVKRNTRVTAIGLEDPHNYWSPITVTAVDSTRQTGPNSQNVSVATIKESTKYTYKQIICTAPLPVVRTVDLDGCHLDYGQSNAFRMLQYGPSTKIGMKFKSRWWEKKGIIGGQSYCDRPIRTVVYPSYGIGESGTGSMIVSYAWTMDALRLGSLMLENGTAENSQLIELVLRDLAAIHDMKYEDLRAEFVDMYPYNWYGNPLTMGAFAFFGPGQFKQVYHNLTRPAADGKLHFAGEAVSTRHAWVVGALDSAWRAVYHFYSKLDRDEPKKGWGKVLDYLKDPSNPLGGGFEEWDGLHLNRQSTISHHLFSPRSKPKVKE